MHLLPNLVTNSLQRYVPQQEFHLPRQEFYLLYVVLVSVYLCISYDLLKKLVSINGLIKTHDSESRGQEEA